MPEKGKTAEVFKGRKVAVGTSGEIIWCGEGKWGWRVGIKDAAGEVHWTAMSNVRVTDAAERITSTEEIVERTDARIARLVESGQAHEWASAYRSYGGAIGGRFSVCENEISALLTELGRTEIDIAATREKVRIREINDRHGAQAVLEARYGERFAETAEDLSTDTLTAMVRASIDGDDARIERATETGARGPEIFEDEVKSSLIGLARKIDGRSS